MLVSLSEVLDLAQRGRFAVPAFNVYNMETVMGAVAAAEEAKAPVILQVYARLFKDGGGYYLSPVIKAAARRARVPVCFHLDHGPSMEEVEKALRYGATGIMFDGSLLPYEENVKATAYTAALCRYAGVPVEGELGHIGSVNDDGMGVFTNPTEAAEFVRETKVSALAVLVGNAHGRYKKEPRLDVGRIAAISEAIGHLPLVLHGGSGIPDEQIRQAIDAGIRKINFGTDVCYSFLDAVQERVQDPKHSIAVDLFMKAPTESVKAFCLQKIYLLGANGAV